MESIPCSVLVLHSTGAGTEDNDDAGNLGADVDRGFRLDRSRRADGADKVSPFARR